VRIAGVAIAVIALAPCREGLDLLGGLVEGALDVVLAEDQRL
jgi:hypothetical protein